VGLAGSFRTFALTQCRGHSPLYERIGLAVADDEAALALLDQVAPSQRRPTLLLGVVHELILRGDDHELAGFYPSVTGHPSLADVWPAFRAFCHDRAAAITERLAVAATQTNEVRRAAPLLIGLGWAQAAVGQPLALLELGASAGLLLHYDRYRMQIGTRTVGPVDSPVRITVAADDTATALVPTRNPDVPWRRGIDLEPVDVTDAEQRRWLEALTWPEATGDRARLRSAMDLAAKNPPNIERGDAVTDLHRGLAQIPDDLVPVVFHTTLFTYLGPTQRATLIDALRETARQRPMCWLPMEAPGFLTTPPASFSIAGRAHADNSQLVLCGRAWTPRGESADALVQVDSYGRRISGDAVHDAR
jgi:hypothetical protein